MRLLVLLHEAFGGRGGIAKFNRDLLTSLCAHPNVREVAAIPRLVREPPGTLPDNLRYMMGAIGGKTSWLLRAALAAAGPRFDVVLCAHINLLPMAFAVGLLHRAPVGVMVHGIEAWRPTGRILIDRLIRRVDFFVSVSAFTSERLRAWTGLDAARGHVLPNAVDMSAFTPGPPAPALIERLGVAGKRVILTLARLEATERYKGVDEILEIMPDLLRDDPDLAYVIAGDGSDRGRLEAKARALGIGTNVVFTGYVPEAEKRDIYRLAHVFAMPGRGEGFGIVFLEAMACGVPVVASRVDGSREAVRDGALGLTVDPGDPDEIRAGIQVALRRPRGVVPLGLDYFDLHHFRTRVHAILNHVVHAPGGAIAMPLPE